MWTVEQDLAISDLTPPEQLWIIAQAMEENGGPREYVLALRLQAEACEELGWWLHDALPTGAPS